MNVAMRLCDLSVIVMALLIPLLLKRTRILWLSFGTVLLAVAYHYLSQTLPFHTILAYGYEIFGGILIFFSSAVTETLMPEGQRRRIWLLFGALALVYVAFGIGIRHDDVRQSNNDRAEIQTLKDNTTKLINSFNSVVPPLEADLTAIKNKINSSSPVNINPKELQGLQSRAAALQTLINTLKTASPSTAGLDLAGLQRDAMSLINHCCPNSRANYWPIPKLSSRVRG
jgi:hypothetical protein